MTGLARHEDLSKRIVQILESKPVRDAVEVVRRDGRNPKTLAALRTAMVGGGMTPLEAGRFAPRILRSARWGDGDVDDYPAARRYGLRDASPAPEFSPDDIRHE